MKGRILALKQAVDKSEGMTHRKHLKADERAADKSKQIAAEALGM